jgi:FkbM family methyltransferase
VLTRRLVKRALRGLGYEIRRLGLNPVSMASDIWQWIRDTQGIKTVIDVGAHDGEFAQFLSTYLGAEATYAFEPQWQCAEFLARRAKQLPNFHVFNVALSDHFGQESLYVNSYAPASSLLRVTEVSRREFPQTSRETPTLVHVAPLDSVLDPDALPKNVLIKVDVQGVEDRVIRGGRRVFATARCVMVEVAFVPLYGGQPLFEEVHALLVDLGFRLAGLRNQIESDRTGQPLFAHCVYSRAGLPARNSGGAS